ncbi:MAG: hypothetical protein QNL62_21820 [Gammaproteobacteria bacterium]|nr:hypothetical protein [Gammaproteobacteria bacterium]
MPLKLIITGLFCMICSNAVHAGYDAADLQKLFTDKKQRARIDAVRSGDQIGSDTRQQTSKIKVSGYVMRSDGKNVVWLNNKNTLDSSKVGGAIVHQSSIGKNKKVTVTVGNKKARLKPGETWSESTGKVKNNY